MSTSKASTVSAGELVHVAVRDVSNGRTIDSEAQIAGMREGPMPQSVSSNDLNDPLNWPMGLKIAVLIQTSLLAAIGGLNTAAINPALMELAREFHVSKVRASYQTTVCIALNGIAPWLWIPLAYKFGRRPIWLATTLLGFVSILSCAYARTYTELLIARIFNGFFPVGFALGATTVLDLFPYHQRGRAMGFFTVTVVNGSHLAPIVGGLLGHYCGWRWIFKFLAIVDAVLFTVALFCLPETMYIRSHKGFHQQINSSISKAASTTPGDIPTPSSRSSFAEAQATTSHISTTTSTLPVLLIARHQTKFQAYKYYLRPYTLDLDYKLNYISAITPTLRLFFSPAAVFPAIYYASMYGFASILPAVTVAAIFTEFFGWNTLTIGLTYGAALTIGGILGEFSAGWICDAVVKREQAAINSGNGNTNVDSIRPEVRLRPIWPGAILTPIGLLIYGFTLQYHTHPALPLFGMGLSCFGLQIITTCTYTYAIDYHTACLAENDVSQATSTPQQQQQQQQSSPLSQQRQPRSAEVAQLFNFIRQMFGFTFAFYVVRMGERIGFHWTFVIFAFCGGVLAFLPLLWLIFFRGRRANDK